jgi:hypothetical protein
MSWVFRRPADYRAKPSHLFALLAIASAASGTAAVTITPSGTITGAGALAGSCAIGFTNEATASGANLTGSCALAITPAATITALGQITGVSAVAFVNSASPIGSVAYPTAQRFKVTKWWVQEVRYSRQLDKLVIFPFSESTGISGQSDLVFGGAGLLRGDGALAGVAATTITPTATLRGTLRPSRSRQRARAARPRRATSPVPRHSPSTRPLQRSVPAGWQVWLRMHSHRRCSRARSSRSRVWHQLYSPSRVRCAISLQASPRRAAALF